jgi:hypothetical protein
VSNKWRGELGRLGYGTIKENYRKLISSTYILPGIFTYAFSFQLLSEMRCYHLHFTNAETETTR